MKARQSKRRRVSKNGKRFLSAADMKVVVVDIAVRNSKIKRGELVPKGNNHYIVQCGCGGTGCMVHGSFETSEYTKQFPR